MFFVVVFYPFSFFFFTRACPRKVYGCPDGSSLREGMILPAARVDLPSFLVSLSIPLSISCPRGSSGTGREDA